MIIIVLWSRKWHHTLLIPQLVNLNPGWRKPGASLFNLIRNVPLGWQILCPFSGVNKGLDRASLIPFLRPFGAAVVGGDFIALEKKIEVRLQGVQLGSWMSPCSATVLWRCWGNKHTQQYSCAIAPECASPFFLASQCLLVIPSGASTEGEDDHFGPAKHRHWWPTASAWVDRFSTKCPSSAWCLHFMTWSLTWRVLLCFIYIPDALANWLPHPLFSLPAEIFNFFFYLGRIITVEEVAKILWQVLCGYPSSAHCHSFCK